MRENLHRFFRAARGAGVRVSPAESIDAMRAVADVGFSDRGILRDTLLLTLAKTEDEKKALGDCFDLFFAQPEPRPVEPEDRPRATTTGRRKPRRPTAPAADRPERLGPLAQMLLSQDRSEMAAAIANASNAAALPDIRYFTQRGIFLRPHSRPDGDCAPSRRSRRTVRDQSGAGGTADRRTGGVARKRARHGFAGAAALRARGSRKPAQ